MRHIHQELVSFLDTRVAYLLSGSFSNQPVVSPESVFLHVLRACVGIREESGDNRGRLIELIQSTVGKAERESWCMSLIQSAIGYVEFKLNARCQLPATESCIALYDAAKNLKLVDNEPAVGDIVIWNHKGTSLGHCGVVVETGDFIRTIEGNTGSSNAIQREGDGVFYKIRSLHGSEKMPVLGFVTVSFKSNVIDFTSLP